MKYVLDVNVALKWVLNEVDSTKARRLRDNLRIQIHDLLYLTRPLVKHLRIAES